MNTNDNKSYCVRIDMVDPSQNRPHQLRKSYPDPRTAIKDLNRILMDPMPFTYYKYDDFKVWEDGKRPFFDIFAEKWNSQIRKSMLFRRGIALSILFAVTAVIVGMVAAYFGSSPTDIWNLGAGLALITAFASSLPVFVKALKETKAYGGVSDYED